MENVIKRLSLQLPENVRKALEKMQEKVGVSFNWYIVLAVEKKLQHDGYLKKEK